ncbi:FAD-dependent oxidoreductase [Microlunatus parietis]|uniref:Phytoene dehydrogenase-like protein n=1 Tax=Microlunatus parietis TaxID=682979 RepID=A0A7Y9LEE0_9ACTN|nr:FAD-dependent oxidoreductase [Microlunatus parietis]NYE74852.1 phytoene dehydrogenase-like protein [Microlunatus parietis]
MPAGPDTDVDVIVIGATLAGLAAAARLAKAGHRVALVSDGLEPGGPWAGRPLDAPSGPVIDDAPPVLTLPAAWRDLFRKSGRPLDAELARSGWELAPAPPARHRFPDGSELRLPTDRGEQYTALSETYGSAAADRWRDLLDDLDEVWQTLRPLGLESELHGRFQLTRRVETILKSKISIDRLAELQGHPALQALVRDVAYLQGSVPSSSPAHAAVDLAVLRRFGRWTMRRADGTETGRTSALIEAVAGRLATRKVTTIDSAATKIMIENGRPVGVITEAGTFRSRAAISTVDPPRVLDQLLADVELPPQRATLRRLRPALAPTVTATRLPGPVTDELTETVQHRAGAGPLVTVVRRAGDTMVELSYDYARPRPDWSRGLAWRGFGGWLVRPPIRGPLPGLYQAGPFSAAGPGLSQTLLSGALASYACHDDLTAEHL